MKTTAWHTKIFTSVTFWGKQSKQHTVEQVVSVDLEGERKENCKRLRPLDKISETDIMSVLEVLAHVCAR
jgi:hypothetical protein